MMVLNLKYLDRAMADGGRAPYQAGGLTDQDGFK